MIIAKLFTETEGGNWKPISPINVPKQIVYGLTPETLYKQPISDRVALHGIHSLMFDDGTIYDLGKICKFRSEQYFPKDETIEYMNKILNKEI